MGSLFGFIISFNFTHGWHKKDKEKHKRTIIKHSVSKSYFLSLKLQIKKVDTDTSRFKKVYF